MAGDRSFPPGVENNDGVTSSLTLADHVAPDSLGRVRPLDDDVFYDLYVKSDTVLGNQAGLQYTFTSDHGDDDAAGDYEHPIRTLKEVERRLRAGNANGRHARIFLCGSGGETFDTPTEGRFYWTEVVRTSYGNGVHDSYRTNMTYIGPRGMLAQAGPATLVTVADVANGGGRLGKIKVTLSIPISASPFHVRMTRAADGREVFAPFTAEETDVDGVSFYATICQASYFSANVLSGDLYHSVIPAVGFISRGADSTFEGVHVVGDGPHRIGDRTAAVVPTQDDNLWPTFERIAFYGRTTVDVQGDVMFDTCDFHDNISIGPGCAARARGCAVEGGIAYAGAEVYRTANSSYLGQYEPSCRTILTGGTQDPYNAFAGLDWTSSAQGAGVSVKNGATMRILKGLAVNMKQSSTVAVTVSSRGRLIMTDVARVCVTARDPADLGFWAVDGGAIRTNDGLVPYGGVPQDLGAAAGPCVYGSVNAVKVGKSVALDFGAGVGGLCEVAGVNGSELSSYDGSRVWAPVSEPGPPYLYQAIIGGV